MTDVAPQLTIPRTKVLRPRLCGDNEAPCVVCGQPVKLDGHEFFVWEHRGGGTAVTIAEGERLNATGEEGGDLGAQPVGRACLKKHPELGPYVMQVSEVAPKGGE